MKKLQRIILRKISLLTILLFVNNLLVADVKPIVVKFPLRNVGTSTVTVGKSNAIATVIVPALGNSKDSLVTGVIQLGVDYQSDKFVVPYNAQVSVNIVTYDLAGTPTINNYVLNVTNQPYGVNSFTSEDMKIFNNQANKVYKIVTTVTEVKIDGIVTNKFPNNLFLNTRIEYIRYGNFAVSSASTVISPVLISPIDLDCNGLSESIEVSWQTAPGAVEYQLEWAFINNYHISGIANSKSPTLLKFDFKNNSTRVTISETNYSLPVISDKGFFIARVRGVGRDLGALATPIYGNWTAIENGVVSVLTSPNQKLLLNSHFESNKNWQYNVTFAEEGKHKDVISYFDGSLRNRQSITQISTDTTTLVGETIYDFTGRGAISVLPTPLSHKTCISPTSYNPAYSFNYIPNFNKADANYVTGSSHGYTKKDFDVVDPSNSCGIITSPMVNTDGASKYYSINNPEKKDQQAFVPDANEYPFTQIEYTPDNTGRIRKQSGVGITHQLGTNRETKYFYSATTQVELDRLFGSEVGNAAHYQKNMVIDANGQISISYIDMAGKTIATALAGSPPPNLSKLSSLPAITPTLTADLFHKDANGFSILNKKNLTPDALEFNSTFLVTTQSVNTFTYNFSVNTVIDSCLKPNICFSCLYDLDIRILDECGTVIYSSSVTPSSSKPPNEPTSKLVGNFSMTEGTVVFKTICQKPSVYNYPSDIITPAVSLSPGVYTISKTLKVNKEARDFYLKEYLKKENNSCFKDSLDFLNEELAKIDTTDCFINCQSCFQALGKKDDFVAQGRGSDIEWEALYEECDQLCGYPKSKCEIAYGQMLADMAPNGQYGQIKTAGSVNLNTSAFPLSVYNSGNVLPKNVIPLAILYGVISAATPIAYWQNPKAVISGVTYNYYFDKNGQRSKINLVPQPGSVNPGGYNLEVMNTALIFAGISPGTFYTYPENLANLNDFVQRWNPNWAKSLINYHPEYCYYEDCIQYSTKLCGDSISSEDFDKKLMSAQTYNDAVSKKLIINSGTNNILNYNMDPFIKCTSTFGTYGTSLVNKYNNYDNHWGTNMSMSQFAASMAHCGMLFGQSPFTIANCTTFGFPVPGPVKVQDSIRNQEWNSLKALYLSEKNKLQIQRSDALKFQSYSGCEYYNGCIGNSDFNPVASGMFNFTPPLVPGIGIFGTFYAKPYFRTQQPCNVLLKDYYKNKSKRFGASSDVKPLDYNQASYQVFLQTGQCANAFELENLMSGMAYTGKVTAVAEALVNHPQFTPNLYNYISGTITPPSTYINYLWKATISTAGLDVNLVASATGAIKGKIHFNNPSTGFNWNNVKSIIQLKATGSTATNSNFNVTLRVQSSPGAAFINIQTTGNTTIILDDCKFKDECVANDFAKDLQILFSALKSVPNGSSTDFNNTTGITVAAPSTYSTLVTQNILNVIGSIGQIKWKNSPAGTNTYELYDSYNLTCKVIIKFTGVVQPGIGLSILNNVTTFTNIKSDYQNFFTVDGLSTSGNLLGTLKGQVYRVCGTASTGVSMGSCGLPEPLTCRTKFHETRKDLEILLIDVLNNKKFYSISGGSPSDLISNTLFVNNLSSQVSPLNNSIYPYVNNNVGYKYIKNYPTIHDTTLTTTIINDILIVPFSQKCALTIKTNNKPYKSQMLLSNLISVDKLTGYGVPSNTGNYNLFYLTAKFNSASGVIYDTIFGYSCFDIQNCNTCADTTKPCCGGTPTTTPAGSDQTLVIYKDSIAVIEGLAIKENNVEMYNTYKEALFDLNTKYNWTVTDNSYIEPQPYEEFSNLGFSHANKTHIRFIKNFDPLVDSKSDLKDLNGYFKTYGHSVNPTKEYERYSKAISKFNARAQAINVDTLIPIQDTIFFKQNMPDSIQLYVKYLNEITVPTNTVMTEAEYFLNNNGLEQGVDNCSLLYKNYVDAYKSFVEYQKANNNTCKEFSAISPMYTLDEFIKNNYCCSNSSYLIFQQYITSFYNQLSCPGPISYIKNCSTSSEIPTEVCAKNYNVYLDMMKKYNQSSYAITNNIYLTNPYPTFTSFLGAGLCNCVLDYIKYLDTYITYTTTPPSGGGTRMTNPNLDPPVAINNYTVCGPPKVVDECVDKYNQYISAVTAYNAFVTRQSNYAPINIIYKADQFTANGFCYCVDGYSQFLLAIVNGTITDPDYIKQHLSIAEYCLPPKLPCPKPNTSAILISPSLPPERNPCVQYKYDLAAANAQLSYQQYLSQQITHFVTLYNNRCLNATENFLRKYEESEFHHTLYYYDQAGNLIRTIPPAGIDSDLFNSIIGPSSTKEIQIQQDRVNKTHLVLSNHNLATTYLYNSLNQLVRQNLPDHDQMTYTKNQYAWGLDTNFNAVTSQFVNASKGYLAGFKAIASSQDLCSFGLSRGMIYESNDGGANWQFVGSAVGANIKKAQFVKTNPSNKTIGFAVGSDGTFMVSYDNGTNWDLVPLHGYAQNINFTDLSINANNNQDKIEGFLVGENGLAINISLKANSSAAPIFNVVNAINIGGTIPTSDVISSITSSPNGTNFDYFISVVKPASNLTHLYKSNSSLTQWDDISNSIAPELTKVFNLRGTPRYYVGGVDGTLLKYDDVQQAWNKVLTNIKGNFKDLYFMDDYDGIAVIEDLPNNINGGIYKTIDGGKNWLLLDAGNSITGSFYKTLNPYVKGFVSSGNTTDKIIACGTKGLVKRISIIKTAAGAYQFGAVNTSISTTNTINDAMVVAYDGGTKYYTIAVGNSGSVYYCNDYTQNTIVWTPISSAPATLNSAKIIFDIKSPNTLGINTKVNGVILDNTGSLYRIESNNSIVNPSLVYAFGTINSGGVSWKDMILKNYNVPSGSANDVYLMGLNPGNNTRFATLSLATPLLSSSTPNLYGGIINNANLRSFAIKTQAQDDIVAVGISGEIFKNSNNSLPTTLTGAWTDQSNKVILSKVNDLTIAGTGATAQLIAVGDQGLYAQKDLSSATSSFNIKKTASLTNFNAAKNYVSVVTGNTGLIVGNNGFVSKFTVVNTSQVLTLNTIQTIVSNALNDVLVNTTGVNNFAYVVGNNGKALFINNLTTATPLVTGINTNTTKNLFGVIDIPFSTNALAMGDNMQVFVLGSNMAMKQTTWFANQITKIHFANALNGYVVGKKGLIRHTVDGGVNWQVVKPYYTSSTTVLDHYAVHSLSNDNAVIGGNNSYISKVSNLTVSSIPQLYVSTGTASNNRINDIAFNGSVGYAVGTNTTGTGAGTASRTSNAGSLWVSMTTLPASNGLNALHIFNDNSFITVGANKKAIFYNGSVFNTIVSPSGGSATIAFNDVIFLDDKNGYIVADNGNFYNTSTLDKTIAIPSVSTWNSISLLDKWLTSGDNNVNLKTISFSDRYDGLIAGNYSNTYKYARKIHDESGKFSTLFWYDRLGRMVVSQNSKQRNKKAKAYSYTIYDELGRIKEVGEKKETSPTSNNFETIFGTIINTYYNSNAIDDVKLTTWINDPGTRTEVTKTYYDNQLVLSPAHLVQENLRKRVASITFEKLYDGIDSTFQHATHYSYDIHGNVKVLVQDNRLIQFDALADVKTQRFKHIDYDYDLISGKVNKVTYQKNNIDQFHHRYKYDADNRILNVETSRDNVIWETDANYVYYKHGPLARVELGNDNVQGLDYAYTIQGWIKGVNSNLLTPETDMGTDGGNLLLPNGKNNNNHLVARDAFGYALGYYANDYSPIDNSKWAAPDRFEAVTAASSLISARNDLFNGNISHMQTTIRDVSNYTSVLTATTVVPLPIGNAYKYDQLNRLDNALSFNNLQTSGTDINVWASSGETADMYKNSFTYDANGNITNQKKYDQNGTQFEDLQYDYYKNITGGRLLQNRLYHVNDNISYTALQPDDIDDQGVHNFNSGNDIANPSEYNIIKQNNNYQYDEIGNLIKDTKEEIASIKWTVYGKIDSLVRIPFSTRSDLKFLYDATGNRIAKIEKTKTATGELRPDAFWKYTYYVRDAEGNVMATYRKTTNIPSKIGTPTPSYKLAERDIYGSSRLGLDNNEIEFIGSAGINLSEAQRVLGNKQYELSNHLGNVLTVVSDRKIAVDANNDLIIDYYLADVVTATDYYPFGSPMSSRSFNATSYRYGFNGKENDNEVVGTGSGTQDYGMRIYNPALGKFLSVDPLTAKYPFLTPYQFASNRPIDGADLDGLEWDGNAFNRLLNTGVSKLKNYAVEKTVGIVSSAMSSVADYFAKHVEVTYYAKVEFKATVGARAAMEVKKTAGLDVNIGSADIVTFSGELNLQTFEFTGTLNYMNKDGGVVFSQGVSGSLSVPIEAVTLGGGLGVGQEKIYDDKRQVTSEKKSANAGMSVYAGNVSVSAEKETDHTTGKDKTTGAITAGVAGAVGVGVVTEGKIETGARVEVIE